MKKWKMEDFQREDGKEEFEYLCILTDDNIDEDIYYYENIKYANCPIKEVQHD